MNKITVVSPVYGVDQRIDELYDRLAKTLTTITNDFEIILVNDKSPDNAWEVIQHLADIDPRLKGIDLSRNFGQHYAITAGLDHAKGDWIVVMDCDLQDKPEEILKLYKKALEGYDIVFGSRIDRNDHFLIKFCSKAFYYLFSYLTGEKHDKNLANFGIFSSKAIKAINSYRGRDRAFGTLALSVGFKRTVVEVEHSSRPYGISSYNFKKRSRLALDQILSHSTKPLRLAIKLGFSISSLAFIYASWVIFSYFRWGQVISGWSSLIVSLYFLSGIIITITGLVGLYIGKIYDEVKNKPLYLIQRTTFDNKN